uniref:Uncharacterized protein TCIL3000_11_7480 n=1 Tax=Trypanosoma congolense (strain IL3000) TaxID=1068625 RepID=G0V0Z1_TRYCI|nr:unnamed protein product [Trypanosoma congolense IL3000]
MISFNLIFLFFSFVSFLLYECQTSSHMRPYKPDLSLPFVMFSFDLISFFFFPFVRATMQHQGAPPIHKREQHQHAYLWALLPPSHDHIAPVELSKSKVRREDGGYLKRGEAGLKKKCVLYNCAWAIRTLRLFMLAGVVCRRHKCMEMVAR